MEVKDKAIDLKVKFLEIIPNNIIRDDKVAAELARVNAMVCVDEIISQWEYIDTYLADLKGDLNPNLKYWYSVKQELEKMK
ncbi:hypothetical protein HZP34_02940 [Elizabethkingia anophelis]|nr:hypothetical protein [Elizabethkingia anophelis]